jgi:hypothetical protein
MTLVYGLLHRLSVKYCRELYLALCQRVVMRVNAVIEATWGET